MTGTKTKPRVLFVCHGHPAFRPGGTEIYTLELFAAVKKRGVLEPFLLVRAEPRTGELPGAPDEPRIVPFESDSDEFQFLTFPDEFDLFLGSMRRKESVRRDFREFLLRIEPDVVHFQHTLNLGVELVREARNTCPRAAILYTLHEFVPICHRNGQMVRTRGDELCDRASPRRCQTCFPELSAADFFLRRKFFLAHLAAVDLFIAPSRFVRQRYIDWGIPSDKICFEENGRQFEGRAARPARPSPHGRFGFFGRMDRFKGPDVLLRAASLLRETDGPRIEVTFFGGGLDGWPEFKRDLLSFRPNLKCSVRAAGEYRPAEQQALMADVDWVVLPSIWWENSPLVIQEAFAARRPVICGDIGGMAEKVKNGIDGLHFVARDPLSLASVMRRAAQTPDLWESLVAGIAPVYPIAEGVNKLETIYRDLMATRPS